MLSPEDNELVTRIAAGTPMGEVMRRYWIRAVERVLLDGVDCLEPLKAEVNPAGR